MIGKISVQHKTGMSRSVIVGICLCFMSLQGMAQNNVPEACEESSSFKAEDFGFNAIDLRQFRFLYGDSVEYSNKSFLDHMSFGIVWHYEKMHKNFPQGYDAALNYGLFVEKELGKSHALRLAFNNGSYLQSVRPIRMDKFQIGLLHSFSWTRYFGGYNPYSRKLEAVTNLGVGAFYSKQIDEVKVGPMFIVGAGVRIQLSPLISLGIDPYLTLVNDSVDYSSDVRRRKHNLFYGADVSLAYTFHQKDHQRGDDLNKYLRRMYHGNTFVDFGLGLQFEPYAKSQLQSNELPFFTTPGPQLKLGIGHWISPEVALRVTANLSSSNWNNEYIEANLLTNHQAYDVRLKNVLANGRLDLLFSPYRILTGKKDVPFDVNAMVGWECGQMIKTAYNPVNLLKTFYDGFSGGLQLLYKYDELTSLYFEPRLTLANYTIPYAMPYDKYGKRYRDYLFSATVGLEFVADNSYRSNRSVEFAPNFSLSLQGGPNYMFVTKDYAGEFYMDYSIGIAGEAQMTPYSGVRVITEYAKLSNRDIYNYQQHLIADESILLSDSALCIGRYGFVNFSTDYVFDLGALLQGNNAHRWNVAIAAGLVYSLRVREKTIISKDEMLWEFRGDNPIATIPIIDHSRVAERSVGIQLGIPVSFRLNAHWSALFEPRARFFPNSYVERMHFRGRTKILSTQLGMRYTF